ncbi:class I histocompatibility antigen, F10 alpha chain-like [Chiloscyllium punctatum]|uniref:class I histocompatibility antigen, F10 alpha chain-like n=1 Tax=Chiloscyllium punctatum TaxID=137246 RepID=UPI003B641A52
MLLILFSISLCFSRVSPESHSLRYYYTSMLNSNDFPKFIHVGVLDDVQITYFDSVIKKDIPRQPWMQTSLKDQYWEQETQRLIDRQRLSLTNVEIAQRRTNSSKEGLNYLQYTSGCEVLEDGTVTGKRQYAFNGQELISFDLEHSIWVAASPYAVSTQNKWNSNKDDNEYKKQYTKRICVDWLNTYRGYGQAFLNRKVVPEANVYYTNGHNVNLHCLVTGFYPRSINVTWFADGVPVSGTHSTGILPNHDGTYQIRVTFQIEPGDDRNHVCHIEHSSLPAPLKIIWEKGGSVVPGMIGAIFVLVLLIFCIAAGIYYRKHKAEVKKRFPSCFTHGSESSGSSTSCEGSQTLHGNSSDTSESAKPLVTPPSSDTSTGGSMQSVEEPLVTKPDPSLPNTGAAPDHMTVEIEK